VEYRTWVKHSVVDRHRFDADPDPDQTFHFDVDPDSYPDPTLVALHMLENQKKLDFIHSSAS
jgi:hypothetical protein